ncbi:MAG: formyl transferase N-terminal protein [Ramlibacter sp.]|jgi:methionyl-tRNA formyltransferase|nr:formyl transferase N-terminal protein [Ramlibacter sp.]
MPQAKVRVAVFGSFYRGYYLLSEMLFGDIAQSVQVVGVATDDPANAFVNPHKRVWQYPHTAYERDMVAQLAEKNDLQVFKDRVNAAPFHAIIEEKWRPDLCVMATFGQRIHRRLIDYPRLGFYNLHPCIDDGWPSKYAGGNPFNALMRDQQSYIRVAFHAIDENFDSGELISMTPVIAIPDQASVIDMHKITSVSAARLAAEEIQKIIDRGRKAPLD